MAGHAVQEELPTRLHHLGTVVRDQGKVRAFMEDFLGFPLVATWCERALNSDIGEVLDFCHTFFALDDGSALAFFQFANPTIYDRCRPKVPAEIIRYEHVALRVGAARYADLKARISNSHVKWQERDHGYCWSLYVWMEDGLQIEFTLDADNVDRILTHQRDHARAYLDRWLAGDHSTNNETVLEAVA